MRIGFVACCRRYESGCACDLRVTRSGILIQTSTTAALAHTTVVATSEGDLVDRVTASHVPNAELLVEPFVSRQRVSQTAAVTRAAGTYRNVMEQGNRQSRQPCCGRTDSIFDSEPDLRLWNLDVTGNICPLCPEMIVPGTTIARRADLLRWVDPKDMYQQVGMADGAVAPYEASVLSVSVLRKNALRQDQTISASGFAAGIDLERVWCVAELTQDTRMVLSADVVCEHRLLALTLHRGKKLGSRPQRGGDGRTF